MRTYTKFVIFLPLLFVNSCFLLWFKFGQIKTREQIYNDYFMIPYISTSTETINSARDNSEDSLLKNASVFCNSSFVSFGNFAKLSNVMLVPASIEVPLEGIDVHDQFQGVFKMDCANKINYTFKHHLHDLNNWLQRLQIETLNTVDIKQEANWTIALRRAASSNLLQTFSQVYNIFLLAKMFGFHLNSAIILWMARQSSADDVIWQRVFGNSLDFQEILKPVLFKHMIWSLPRVDSPLNFENNFKMVPYLEEFRNLVLEKHGLSTEHKLNCNALNIVVLYKPGVVSSKASNNTLQEMTLYESLEKMFSQHQIDFVNVFQTSLMEQLGLVAAADILIGMHRSELALFLFVPKHSAVLEIFSYDTPPTVNQQYKAIAEWRSLQYHWWGGPDNKNYYDQTSASSIASQIENVAAKIYEKLCLPNNIR